jgi:arylsulfatase A-like enzyme
MPHVKGLSGWTFENAYAVCPESIKGLASWLCSFCPTPHTWPGQYRASAFEATSLATVLKSAGYSTALFHAGRFDYLGMAEVLEARGFDVLRDASAIEAKDVRPFGVDEDSVVDAALAHLDGATHPAFVAYLPIAGHHPYLAPGASNGGERDERARYLLDLAHGDRAIGRLFDGIRARGLWERTLFVVHGDHGEAFGEHEGNRVHTFQVYEENVRVPLFIVAPGSTLTPQRIESLVALTDLAPTVLDLLGLPAPADWEGQSALSPRARVIRMFADYGVEQLALRDGPYKFVWSPETGRPELYDVSCDPDEHVNLADAHRERVARYLADLRRLRDRSARGEVR